MNANQLSMKTLLFAIVLIIIPLGIYAQPESNTRTSQNELVSLNGEFRFTVNQDTYYVRLNKDDRTFEELNAQGQIIGFGEFKISELGNGTLIPDVNSSGIAIQQNVSYSIENRTSNEITVNVFGEGGSANQVILEKL